MTNPVFNPRIYIYPFSLTQYYSNQNTLLELGLTKEASFMDKQ